MKRGLDGVSGNFLFALNIFVVFVVLFERELQIPHWVQPFGRMHTLVLHFPIVLLLLALALEFFRFKTDYSSNAFYQRFTSALFLAGVITSGLAVIMGIFLSREEGYDLALLSRHKWSGVSVFFISSVIYTWRNSTWYKDTTAKAGAVLIMIALISTGHFGAALTHGDNFLWQPVLAAGRKAVPVEEARVFEHVIMPVFEQKCISCHNASKLKGKLMLTDSASIAKGGKSGEVFVAGKPEASLLIRRMHLPEEDKKHMPPSGNPQLSDDERELLYHWVKSGPRFDMRVTGLPEGDSLRIVASRILKQENRDEVFPFPAVSFETLEALNSNYRVVSPLARNSPALVVSLYHKDSYTPASLDELKEVKRQVISLDLGRMPVEDEHLKYVARFENLRSLNLNFTGITGHGLQVLSGLKELRELSLAGTRISYADLRENIPLFKRLESLAVWDTRVTPAETEDLRRTFRYLSILGAGADDAMPLIKLNPPRLKNRTLVFEDSISLQLYHPVNGVDIRFTTDDSEPDSISSPIFRTDTVLKASTRIKARACKAGWLTSDVAMLNVYRSACKPDTAILLSRLNRVHTANGAQTFFDHELGSFNANSPAWANNWAGVIRNDLVLLLRYNSPMAVSSVSLNTLVEMENVIFPPASIEIWGGSSENDLRLIHRVSPPLPQAYQKPFIKLFDFTFEKQEVAYLKIIARPVMKIPAWHKNKGKPALLLVDEILIN